jgi:glutamyl-tRNA synthetase
MDGTSLMLAVCVDDAAMSVTKVVCGDNLLDATLRQLPVYRALGLEPPHFMHVQPVVGPDGLHLARYHGDIRIASFRKAGVAPEAPA